jgi:hypothetical protein
LASCKPAGVIYTRDGKIECGGDGKAIILKNNPAATNPTFDETVAFIEADATNYRDYIKSGPDAYVCSDFAEEVHNNAEAAGIRAGWVGITFNGTEEGHALDCFETTDRGLIYIDCTNGGSEDEENTASSGDAIAYIETGKEYGILNIDVVVSSPYDYYTLQYEFYAEREKAWQDYQNRLDSFNKEVDRYNKEISGKVYTYGSPEEQQISAWKEELQEKQRMLERLEKELGKHWYESEFSEYTVEDVLIHW